MLIENRLEAKLTTRIAIIIAVFTEDDSSQGVFRKYEEQQEAYAKLGLKCDLIYPSKSGVMRNQHLMVENKLNDYRSKIFHLTLNYFNHVAEHIKEHQYHAVIFRYHLSFPSFKRAIRNIKSSQPDLMLILDIPTYPYEAEYRSLLGRFRMTVDIFYRFDLNRYIDFILTTSNAKEIFNLPTIKVMNGCNAENYKLKRTRKRDGEIHLLAFGKLWRWYGLDRLLYGLAEYYTKDDVDCKVKLSIIGNGKEKESLKTLTSDLELFNYVRFKDFSSDINMDKEFDHADIGIGSLGIHRVLKSTNFSSLKHREYASRGIPFVYSGNDEGFKNFKYTMAYCSGDDPIDVNSIVDFFNSLSTDHTEIIRSHAKSHLNWENQLASVVKKLL